ncbi:MAG TPA: methyl-accepting chemotaxis protein [Polyangiaceae bacterium]|nr:methyl-accepting chemotaxis protein [Polyangiaceae bacterium]
MDWFKNLSTLAKLMSSFALMGALMGFVGYQGTASAERIKDLLDRVYEKDLIGSVAVKEVALELAMIRTYVRQGVLDEQLADMQRDGQLAEESFRKLDTAIADAEKTFMTAEGKALIAQISDLVPELRTGIKQVFQLTMDQRNKEAMQRLKELKPTADQIFALAERATAMKEKRAEEAFAEASAAFSNGRQVVLGITLVSAVMAMLLGYAISKMISAPLTEASGVLSKVAERDLSVRMTGEAHAEFRVIKESLNGALDMLSRALTDVRVAAEQVADTSQQLSSASEEISSGAQEQASSLEETAATLEEITSTVKQNADNARQANQLAANSRGSAEKGGQVVGSAVSAMGEINSSSKRIADIITTIDEIAFQTNLLALNAAVEAARAGEQGRGFAVVAAEVRNLAQHSATAAKEIKGLIQDSVRKVENGSELVNRSGQTLTEIVSGVKRVTDIVAEIAAASQEQASGIDQVSKAMAQMDQVTQANSSQTEEMSSTAEELASTAERLRELLSTFRLDLRDEQSRPTQAVVPPKLPMSKPRAQIRRAPPARSASMLSAHVAGTGTNGHAAPVLEADSDGFVEF